MPYRVYIQKELNAPFTNTGVMEYRKSTLRDWKEICKKYGYTDVVFIECEEEPKRGYRKRRIKEHA